MSYIPSAGGVVSTNNSNETPLGISGNWTGTGEDVSAYASVSVFVFADEDGTIDFEWSTNNTDWNTVKSIFLEANNEHEFILPVTAKYFRAIFDNGITEQTAFRLQTILHPSKNGQNTLTMDGHIDEAYPAVVTRGVVTGKNDANDYVNVGVTNEGHLKTHISGPRTAFGALQIAESVPIFQTDFIFNVNAELWDTSDSYGGGTVATSASVCTIKTGTTAGWKAGVLAGLKAFRYRPGQGLEAVFSALFSIGEANAWLRAGVGVVGQNGLWFYDNEGVFGILITNATSDTAIAQTAWNIDVCDGSHTANNPSGFDLDQTKGNVFKISYQWLGFGAITFNIQHPVTAEFFPVHRVEYGNANTTPSLRNPSFPFSFHVESDPSVTTDLHVKTASVGAFCQGPIIPTGPIHSIDNTKTGVTTTLTNILTIQNKATYQTLTNTIPIIMQLFSGAVDGTKPAIIKLVLNTTLGGTPSYGDISVNTSVVSYDTAGTTLTGGTTLASFTLAKTAGITEILKDLNIELNPGDTLTFAAQATSSTTDVTISGVWLEDM